MHAIQPHDTIPTHSSMSRHTIRHTIRTLHPTMQSLCSTLLIVSHHHIPPTRHRHTPDGSFSPRICTLHTLRPLKYRRNAAHVTHTKPLLSCSDISDNDVSSSRRSITTLSNLDVHRCDRGDQSYVQHGVVLVSMTPTGFRSCQQHHTAVTTSRRLHHEPSHRAICSSLVSNPAHCHMPRPTRTFTILTTRRSPTADGGNTTSRTSAMVYA